MSKQFYVWVTVLTDAYTDLLISKFVRRGYDVSPGSSSGEVSRPGPYSSLISLDVSTSTNTKVKDKVLDAAKFLDEVKTVLGEFKALYYSIIVQEVGGQLSWVGSNMPKPKKEEPTRFDKVSAEAE